MRAPLGTIIPTLNAQEALPDCIEMLFEGLFDGLIREMVVSDGGSTDDSVAIAEALGARVITGPAGRGGQLRRGVAAAQSEWLLVLHADTRLAPGWAAKVARHMQEAPDHAGYFWLRFDAAGLAPAWVARWANFRARWLGLPYGDQALLIHRDLLASLGGYPDLPLMEDVALARALRGRLRPLGAVAVTSAERYQREGWLRRGARNLSLLARYFLGADPETLARAYRKST
ncbi:MAG: TIGR04283 family arsenosugar biosynthesis glycosyltransferase [Mangrovicoccus sp.]|nr:TIGR04283 family arsenosugar biosynthesis glycosyltransferase [Mangrovicoccus sp.]